MKFKRVSDMKKCSKYQSRACKIPVVDLMSIDRQGHERALRLKKPEQTIVVCSGYGNGIERNRF